MEKWFHISYEDFVHHWGKYPIIFKRRSLGNSLTEFGKINRDLFFYRHLFSFFHTGAAAFLCKFLYNTMAKKNQLHKYFT